LTILGVAWSANAFASGQAPGGQALSASAKQALAWLPGERSVTGWRRTKPPQVFGADNLWEFIDGAADAYVGYGFEELVSVTCADAQLAAETTIDVYRMADALNAFGIYAQERNPRATFLTVGGEGYEAPNVLNFWNGRYYVKLRATPTNARIAASLRTLAQQISERIGPPATLARTIPPFPAAGQVPHSVKYLPANILGQAYLTNGFEAQYTSGVTRWRLTTASFRSAQQATEALGRYRTFVASNGRISRDVTAPGDGGFVGSDPYNGLLVVIRAGERLVFALGAPSEPAAIDMVTALLARSRPRQEVR
jgi:hypothetical protein